MATSNSDAQLQRVATDSNGCDLGTNIPKACVVEECPDDDIEVPFRNTDRSRMESRTGISEPYFIEGPQNFSTKPQQTNNMAYTKNHVIGDAYYHTYNGPIYFAPADGARYSNFQGQGFTFGMDSYVGDAQGKASFASTSKLRLQHVSMKQSSLPPSLDFVEVYKPYAKVKSTKVRNSVVKIARLCLQLDRIFAALFVHILQARGRDEVSEHLGQIRRESRGKNTKDSLSESRGSKVYLGDLGHFCEALHEHHETKGTLSAERKATGVPEFNVTHGTKDTFLQYLQDGLEVPYWKMMLDFFSAFRANETTLGSDAVALAITSMRAEVYKARLQLDAALTTVTKSEDIGDIVQGIEKRITILSSFTDRLVADPDGEEEDDEPTENTGSQLVRRSTARIREKQACTTASEQDQGKLNASPETKGSSLRKPVAPAQTQINSVLAALSLVAIVAGMVPFVEGFCIARDSSELGTKQDADYWLNISNGLMVILSNFAMVLPLWKSSWAFKTHIITALWVVSGIACAIASVAIYVDYNTAWSSLLAFFATIAGFGATLSITMTEANSDAESKKNK